MKFEKEVQNIKNPAIMQIARYLMTRDDIKDNLEKENKSLGGMWQYIINEMSNRYKKQNGAKSGGMGCSDEEVYALAIHYYDEDDIKVETINSQKVEAQTTTNTATSKTSVKASKKNKVAEGQLTLFDAIGD